jgi:hypothetical protein
MSVFQRNGRDFRSQLGPVSFMRLTDGKPRITQLTLGSLWVTRMSGTTREPNIPQLTVNWGQTLVFTGPFLVDRRTARWAPTDEEKSRGAREGGGRASFVGRP